MSDPVAMRSGIEACVEMVSKIAAPANAQHLRVGVPFRSIPGWGAGIGFYRMFMRSLGLVAAEQRLTIGAVIDRSDDTVLQTLAGLPGERWSIIKPNGKKTSWKETAGFHKLDVIFDLFEFQPSVDKVGVVTWIPDFQHVRLPESFTTEDVRYRNHSFEQRADLADVILCSSEAVARDLRETLPQYAEKECVARFPSNLVFETMPEEMPTLVSQKYHLPEKFCLVANQFWSHKNHQVVLEAVALARQRGVDVPVVLTGLPLDYRDPSNSPTSSILQRISLLGVHDLVRPLGQVPYRDLIQLMRTATLIIQPSRFEGWSTIVQDAKALGRPVFCSDITVHREQSPDPETLFGCDDPAALCSLLQERWPSLSSNWDSGHEGHSLRNHLEVAREYGNALSEAARRSFALSNK